MATMTSSTAAGRQTGGGQRRPAANPPSSAVDESRERPAEVADRSAHAAGEDDARSHSTAASASGRPSAFAVRGRLARFTGLALLALATARFLRLEDAALALRSRPIAGFARARLESCLRLGCLRAPAGPVPRGETTRVRASRDATASAPSSWARDLA